jgi:hypothetical protein
MVYPRDHIESERAQHMDAMRYHKYHQLIHTLDGRRFKANDGTRSPFFREYALLISTSSWSRFYRILFFESNLLKVLYSHQLGDAALCFKEEWMS